MALAIVRWREEQADGQQVFDVAIGTNRFYAWAVGSGDSRVKGVPMLSSTSRQSPLLGPLEPDARGRAVLRVPGDTFDADGHHLQLLSFRDEQLRGPAASPIVEVPWQAYPQPASARTPDGPRSGPPGLPAGLSHAQFLDALTGIVSQILPAVQKFLPVVGQLLGGAATPAPAAAPAAPGAAPDLGQLLAALLGQLQKASATAPAAAAPPASTASTASSRGGRPQRYSYASWVQLLAALPALAPLLEKLLTPETVKAVLDSADPTKMVKTVLSGLMDAAKIGQEATDKLHEHLRALNPGLGDDLFKPLLDGLSDASSLDRPRHTISRQVRLGIADLAPVELAGYPQIAFRHGETITLPVTVDTPRPIRRATLLLRVKDLDSLHVLAERTWSVPRAPAGRLPVEAVLPAALGHRLAPNREYLLDLTLTWPGRNGVVGTSITQLIRLVGGRTFDSMVADGPPVGLDDVQRDRAWWHRVWATELESGITRVEAELRYHYRLDAGARTENRRAPTQVRLRADRRRLAGVISAGLDVSPAELSRLARRLGGSSFDTETLAAMADPAFRAAFDRSARATVSVHARRGARLAVWVWPELTPHAATFLEPVDTSPLTGQVLSFTPVAVTVPVPAIAHVVSTRSE